MKKVILFLVIIGMFFSCDKNEGTEIQETTNNVLLLKVDFLTNIFEGGKELEFSSDSSNFTISSTYQAPGDFGSVQLFYDELNEKIFDGTIIWMGLGERSYPETIELPSSFPILTDSLPIPDSSMFENVMYSEYAYYPDTIEYSNIWNSINNLEIVSNYRNSNPTEKVNLFLYTPSVGIGYPAEWDWYIFFKN
jgi:hypothetical protein